MARTTKSTPDGLDVTTGEAREDAAVETSPNQPAPLVAVAAGDTATDPAGQAIADVTIDVKPQGEVDPAEGQGPAVADVAAAASVLADAASKAAQPTFEPHTDAEVSGSGDVEVVMLIAISGLRDGEAWPRVGGKITLPADEAAQYVANGYVAVAE
ncbi:hypothetical protein [Microbacterium sp. NPDC089188]|uniref:hypothetical protein n=1 Tax=Microbacterium sp. NPDC089188 TaxID=3154971 RepID=UPI003418CE03